jgi:hypothetical protein
MKKSAVPATTDMTSTSQGQIPQMSMRGISASPLRAFLRTESASARLLVVAVAVTLIWANVAPAGYNGFWALDFPVRFGELSTTLDLRGWVNSGAMTLFFLVAGLEARREFDLGDLRDRRRLILPVVAGLAGMAIPVLIYLAVNHFGDTARGWGVAMSTTPHWRWASSRSLAAGCLIASGRSCLPCSSLTTSCPLWSSWPPTAAASGHWASPAPRWRTSACWPAADCRSETGDFSSPSSP